MAVLTDRLPIPRNHSEFLRSHQISRWPTFTDRVLELQLNNPAPSRSMQETPERDPHWNDPVMEGRKLTAGRTDYFLTSSTPIFSRPQIDLLKALVDAENAPAGIEGYGETTPVNTERQRRTRVRWLNADDYRWVYEVIWAEASRANALFQFDVVPMWDTIQLALYDAAAGGCAHHVP